MSSAIPSFVLPPDLQQHRYLAEKEVSALTGRAVQSLRNDRCRGTGIVYYKVGGSVRYKLGDVLRFMEQHRIDPALRGNGR